MTVTPILPRPRVVDLFSGAGGISLGFEAAGYEVAAGLDFSPAASATFAANFPGALSVTADLTKPLPERTVADIVGGGVNVVVGGPSCQGFSTSGGLSRSDGRDEADKRNLLFVNYLDLVSRISPEWVVFENVPGLLLYGSGKVALDIVGRFRDIGYDVAPMILLAADFGVPQLRRRLIFVGSRTGSDVPFPAATHGDPDLWRNYALPFAHLSRIGCTAGCLPHVSFGDACMDLPDPDTLPGQGEAGYGTAPSTAYQRAMREGSTGLTQHVRPQMSTLDAMAASRLLPGQNWTDIPLDLLPPRFSRLKRYDATAVLRRLRSDAPSYTVTTKFNDASTGAYIHPVQPRTLTGREAARLQSFPDRFRFIGSAADVRRQVGNAVPPLLARAVAEALYPSVMRDAFGIHRAPTRETVMVSRDSIRDGDQIGLKAPRARVPSETRKAA